MCVVQEIVSQDSPQAELVENDDVVQALAADGPDETLDEGILPGTSRCREDFLNAHSFCRFTKLFPITAVAVAQQIAGSLVPGESLEQLLCGPIGSRMGGDGKVKRAATLMVENDEDEQELEGDRGNDEEIYGDQVLSVVFEKGAPSLRGRFTRSDDVFGNSGLRDLDADFQQFSVDARSAPEGIGRTHLADKFDDLGRHGRATWKVVAFPFPIQAESLPVPSDHGFGFDDEQCGTPLAPEV